MSRSIKRRVATQKGLPLPAFDTIPPRPQPGWTVHAIRDGRRLGVVRRVIKHGPDQNRVVWIADDYQHEVKSTMRWEDTPHGVYQPERTNPNPNRRPR